MRRDVSMGIGKVEASRGIGVRCKTEIPPSPGERTLLIADVHANGAALEAVLAVPHDAVICLGDIVGYGPDPAMCVAALRHERALVVQGNHDRATSLGVSHGCCGQWRQLAEETAAIARAQLGPVELEYLRTLPRWTFPTVAGRTAMAIHATPRDVQYERLGPCDDEWRRAVAGVRTQLLLVAHSHEQFRLNIGGLRVVNPGSVGQPRDGDPRAAYAVIEADGTIGFERQEYVVQRTTDGLAREGIRGATLTALTALLRTGAPPFYLPPPSCSLPSSRQPLGHALVDW